MITIEIEEQNLEIEIGPAASYIPDESEIDGGSPSDVYLESQLIDGGTPSTLLFTETINGGNP